MTVAGFIALWYTLVGLLLLLLELLVGLVTVVGVGMVVVAAAAAAAVVVVVVTPAWNPAAPAWQNLVKKLRNIQPRSSP